LILIVSWIKALWTRDLLAMVIASGQLYPPTKDDGELTVLAQKSDIVSIGTPDHILDWRGSQFSKNLLLLDVKQGDGCGGREDEGSGSTVEYIVGLNGALDSLDDVVG
jgi:hypothetical protein